MTPTSTIRIVGEVMVDVIAHVSSTPAPGSDTPATITDEDGGSAANVAAWLADLGAPVQLIARIGDDARGSAALDQLAAAGVAVSAVRDPVFPTGRCMVLVTPDGERTMFPDPGANAHLASMDIDPTAWLPGDHLHVSGYSLLRQGSRDAALTALAEARRRGLTVSVDASSEAPLRIVGAEIFLGWLEEGDLLFANAAEARALTSQLPPADALDYLAGRGLTPIIKMGAEGAVAARGDERWSAPAEPARVHDTTGAGDAFAAGFLSSWVSQGDMAAALGRATRIAARAVTGAGGRP
jgi:sugar/nucleoside kinase (ribokinase family)